MSRLCLSASFRRLTSLPRAPPISSSQLATGFRSRRSFDAVSRYSTGSQVDKFVATPRTAERPLQPVNYDKRRRPRNTVIVRGFDPETTSVEDIRRLLSPYGPIRQLSKSWSALLLTVGEAHLPTDMHGRSVCYVEFAKVNDAMAVISSHRGFPLRIREQILNISFGVDAVEVGEPSNSLWVAGLDTSTRPNLEQLRDLFHPYGEVENIILSAWLCFQTYLDHSSFPADRKGLPTCIVRFSSVRDAEKAILAHREKPIKYRGLVLQLRFSNSKPSEARTPNPTLHVAGFCGDEDALLALIPEQTPLIQNLYMCEYPHSL